MKQKIKSDVKEQIDKFQKEIERRCDKDYPKSEVKLVHIKLAFK